MNGAACRRMDVANKRPAAIPFFPHSRTKLWMEQILRSKLNKERGTKPLFSLLVILAVCIYPPSNANN